MTTATLFLSGWILPGAAPAIPLPTDEQTLCEQNTPFAPQVTIGSSSGSITYSSSLPILYYSFKLIRVNGTLIIDTPTFLLLNCKVQMGPGATIQVNEGNLLDAFKTEFFSCVQMWRGIDLKSAARLRLISCLIEDAEYAINTESSSIIALRENVFNRNHIGIRLRPTSSESNILNFTYFRNNVFKGSSPLNPPYEGQQKHPPHSYAGIDAAECSFSVGDNTAPNTFTQLIVGINALNAIIAVRNCRFLDLDEQYNNEGIYAEGGRLDVTWGGTEATRSLFKNLVRGIRTFNTAVNVRHSSFSIAGNGINSLYSSMSSGGFSASYNDFDMGTIGTSIFTNRPFVPTGTAIDIFENEFVAQGAPWGILAGIQTWGANNLTTDNQALIRSNIFSVSGNSGITYCTWAWYTGHNISITHNKYYFGESTGQTYDTHDFAISMSNIIEGGDISFNEIYGTASPGDFFRAERAISAYNSPGIRICGNTINNTQAGLVLSEDNSPAIISDNSIGRHRIGLWIKGDTPMAGIGEQIRTNNRWSADPDDYIDWAAYLQPFLNPLLSQFTVQSSDPGILPSPRFPNSGWFDSEPGPLNSCIGAGESLLSNSDLALISGGLQMPAIQQWESERRLLRKIQFRPTGTPIGAEAQAFLSAKAGTALGRMVQAESMMAQAMEAVHPWRDTLSAIHALAQSLIDSLWAVEDALALPDSDNTLNEPLALAKAPLLWQLEDLRLQERQIMEIVNAEIQPLLEDALDYNDATQVNQPWESARKQLNHYYIRQWMGVADTIDQGLLFSIALQNPESAGEAVREARGLITDPVWREVWAEYLDFPPGPAPQLAIPNPEHNAAFGVWPNPASGRVHFRLPADISGHLLIYDMWGRKRFERAHHTDASQGDMEVITLGWQPGMYQGVFLPESGASMVIPFVVH